MQSAINEVVKYNNIEKYMGVRNNRLRYICFISGHIYYMSKVFF